MYILSLRIEICGTVQFGALELHVLFSVISLVWDRMYQDGVLLRYSVNDLIYSVFACGKWIQVV